MRTRSLKLRREALTELTRRETAGVVGAAATKTTCLSVTGNCDASLPDCWSWFCTNGPCASDFQQCTSGS